MRDFGAEGLATLDPAQLRVAARVEPMSLRFRPGSVRLTLVLSPLAPGRGDEVHVFGLREVPVEGTSFFPADARGWQVYALDADGLAAMRMLQPGLVHGSQDYGGYAFSMDWAFDGPPPTDGVAHLDVRLQLSARDAPLILFDRAPLRFTEAGGATR